MCQHLAFWDTKRVTDVVYDKCMLRQSSVQWTSSLTSQNSCFYTNACTHTRMHTHMHTHTHTHTHSTLYSGPPHPQITYTQSIQQQYTESLQEQPGGNCLTMKQICKVKGTTAKILMGGAAVSWAGATKNILKEAYKKQKNQRPRKLQLMWTKPWEEFKKTKNKTCTSWQTKEHVKITGTVLKAHVL